MREMNLLPEEYLYKQEQKRRKKNLILGIILFILLLILSYLSIYYIEYNIRREIAAIKTEINSLEKVRETQLEISASKDVLEGRLVQLKSIEENRVDHYIFMSEIENTLPNEITIDNLTYHQDHLIIIDGTATKADEIADFMVNLAKIDGVEDVILEDVHYDSEEESPPSFTVNFTYNKERGGQADDTN